MKEPVQRKQEEHWAEPLGLADGWVLAEKKGKRHQARWVVEERQWAK